MTNRKISEAVKITLTRICIDRHGIYTEDSDEQALAFF
jgi:hypothetical protein